MNSTLGIVLPLEEKKTSPMCNPGLSSTVVVFIRQAKSLVGPVDRYRFDLQLAWSRIRTASPITAEAVAEWHSLDVGAVVGVGPACRVGGAAVETRHALQKAFAPEDDERTVRIRVNADIIVLTPGVGTGGVDSPWLFLSLH